MASFHRKPEVSPTIFASAEQESSKTAQIVLKIDQITEETISKAAILLETQQNIEKNLHNFAIKRKKKLKPDQLLCIKSLLLVNFFGVVVIIANILFVFIRLFSLIYAENPHKQLLYLTISLEIVANFLFIASWTQYFVAALKFKQFLLLKSKICVFSAILCKIPAFSVYLAVFFRNIAEDVAFIAIFAFFFAFSCFRFGITRMFLGKWRF